MLLACLATPIFDTATDSDLIFYVLTSVHAFDVITLYILINK